MKFPEWIEKNNIDLAMLAHKMKYTPKYISQVARGSKSCSKRFAQQVEIVSCGAVTEDELVGESGRRVNKTYALKHCKSTRFLFQPKRKDARNLIPAGAKELQVIDNQGQSTESSQNTVLVDYDLDTCDEIGNLLEEIVE